MRPRLRDWLAPHIRLLWLVLGSTAMMAAADRAPAQIVTFNFSGVVTELDVNAGLFGPFTSVNVGDLFTGHFSYEIGPGNPDQLPGDPERRRYDGLEFVVDGAAIAFEPPVIGVTHDQILTLPPAPPASFDRFAVLSSSPGSLYLNGISLQLRGPYGAAFTDDSLPTALDLGAFSDSQSLAGIRAFGLLPNPDIDDAGQLMSLEQVPEPGTTAVLASLSVALLVAKSRGRRNSCAICGILA
jgi:hypothetical protein